MEAEKSQNSPYGITSSASFCYLEDMLSIALWTFNHNMCENRLEEVQGAATISLFLPPL